MKTILILGASGSIGSKSLDILKEYKNYILVGISIGKNIKNLDSIINNFKSIKHICLKNKEDYENFKTKYKDITFYYGDSGLIDILRATKTDLVLNALSGFVGFLPSIVALENKSNLALANKETLVCGGEIVKRLLKENNLKLYAIDSEHVAINKCLNTQKEKLKRIVITCSGGPFLTKKIESLKDVTPEEALNHPTWSMGNKITIDSATLINKVFEIIEAYYLFDTEKIDVIMHPQSICHSMVEFIDGSYLLDIGPKDMKNPILYALSENKREKLSLDFDIECLNNLTFSKPDVERKQILNIGYEVIKRKGNYGAILNASNDVAVSLFLEKKIAFLDIYRLIYNALANIKYISNPSVEELIATIETTKKYVLSSINEK